MTDFSKIFIELRKSRDLTQEDMAKILGVGSSTIGMWETGKRTPTRAKYEAISDFFNVDIDYLYGKTDIKRRTMYDDRGNEYTYIPPERGYYTDKETAAMAQELFDNPDYRMLFDAAKDSKPEDIKMVADMLTRLKQTNPDG
jgi:transcriptional regulator with XRE-family HTH domain